MSQILTLNGNVVTNGNNILTAPESTSLEANKNVSLVGGTTIVEPSTGYDSMGQVTANVAELDVYPSTISTLVGTTWYLNETLTSFPWSVEDDQKYAEITTPLEVKELELYIYAREELVYEYSSGDPDGEGDIWIEAYTLVNSVLTASSDSVRIVTFTGGTVMTDANFISWLQENAVFVSPSSFTTSIDSNGTISVTANQGGYINSGEGFAITQTIEAHNTPSYSGPTSSSGSVSISHTQPAGFTLGGTSSTSFTLTTKSAQTYIPTTTNQTIAAGRWLTGTQTILGDANLIASNIVSGVSIFGVTGTAQTGGLSGFEIEEGTYTPTSNIARPTISFAKTHSTTPFYVAMVRTSSIGVTNNRSYAFEFFDFYRLNGTYLKQGSTTSSQNIYAYVHGTYVVSSNVNFVTSRMIYPYTNSGSSDSSYTRYYVNEREFMPRATLTSSVYWANGATHKWIAIWKTS